MLNGHQQDGCGSSGIAEDLAARRERPRCVCDFDLGGTLVKPYRSMLFVPGHKSNWAEKAVAAGADAIILDLEDSVPAADKADARKTVRETIGRIRAQG